MRKFLGLSLVAVTVLISACGNAATKELDQNSNKAQAKVDQTASAPAAKQDQPKQDKKDIWTYYNDAKWSDNFNGLKQEIEKVVVSDKAPEKSDPNKLDASAVGVRFKIENTTKDKFTAYPDQARLVTSTGEQIDMPEMVFSDHIGGEIDEGVIKEGNVIWYLQRGHAEDIKWVKITWKEHPGAEDKLDSPTKTYEVKIDLKK